MISTNFDFAYLQEQIIEPLFRKVNNIKFLALISSLPQEKHDDWATTFYPVYRQRAQWNSTKLAFEYILNQEYNTLSNQTPPIFIRNTPNTDINVFLYNEGETLITKQVYTFNDSNVNGIYPNYNPFGVYTLNQKARSNTGGQSLLVYVARVNNPIPNSLFDENYWLVDTYLYNEEDYLNAIDFVVYVPIGLYNPSYDVRIKGFIDTIKLFNTKYVVVYY